MRRQLHWLPIRQRYVFKLATVTYKARLSGLPAYLQCEIHDYHPSRTLRSTSALLLRSSNQPLGLHHLQRERFVQPLLHRLKTELFKSCPRNCFWRHRSAPDSLANWHVFRVTIFLHCIVFVFVYILVFGAKNHFDRSLTISYVWWDREITTRPW